MSETETKEKQEKQEKEETPQQPMGLSENILNSGRTASFQKIAAGLDMKEAEEKEEKEDKEEKESESKKHQPAPNSPRFNEIYGKMKGYQTELSSTLTELQTLKKEVSDLRLNQNTSDKRGALREFDAAIKKAVEDSDLSLLQDLNDKKTEYLLKTHAAQAKAPEKAPSVAPAQDVETQVAVTLFTKANPWFETDLVMQGAAIALDRELQTNADWMHRSIADRFEEVGKVVKKRFGVTDETPVGSPVEGVTDSPSGKVDPKTRLTDLEKIMAKKLLCHLSEADAYKEYAKQK